MKTSKHGKAKQHMHTDKVESIDCKYNSKAHKKDSNFFQCIKCKEKFKRDASREVNFTILLMCVNPGKVERYLFVKLRQIIVTDN